MLHVLSLLPYKYNSHPVVSYRVQHRLSVYNPGGRPNFQLPAKFNCNPRCFKHMYMVQYRAFYAALSCGDDVFIPPSPLPAPTIPFSLVFAVSRSTRTDLFSP